MEVTGKGAESKSGKRSRREVTADRRLKESNAIREILDVLPVSRPQLEKANQNSLLALTANYMRVRKLLEQKGRTIMDMKSLSMEEQLMFRGFVLVMDCSRIILYASENITDQLGPYLADVIGQPFSDMMHPVDRRNLEACGERCKQGDTRGMFVMRLRTSMAPALRSEARMEYKKVFVTTYLKTFGKEPSKDSTVAVFLCRTEDLAGFPEIVLGGYVDFVIKFPSNTFSSVDPKTPWLLGYKIEDLIGQHPGIFKHPADFPYSEEGHKSTEEHVKEKLMRNGTVEFPKSRVLTAWGEWLWVSTVVSLRKDSSEKADLSSANIRMSILGPDTNGMVTHTDRSVQAITTNGMVTHTDRSVQAITTGMSVGAGDPTEPEPLQPSYSMSAEGDPISTSQVTPSSVDTLLDWDELVRTNDPVTPFNGGLLEAENSSTNGSSGYSSNPASPPWPLSATASSSTSNLWSSSSSPHQWCPTPKEEDMTTCGEYGSPFFAQNDTAEVLYAHTLNALGVQAPPQQVDASIDDMLFSVLNTAS